MTGQVRDRVAVEGGRAADRLDREDWFAPLRLAGGEVVLQLGASPPHHYLAVDPQDHLGLWVPPDGNGRLRAVPIDPAHAYRMIQTHRTVPVPVENAPVSSIMVSSR